MRKLISLGTIVVLLCAGCTTGTQKASEPGTSTMQPTDLRNFIGITWVAEDIDGRGVMDNLQSQLEIVSDGEVAGLGGCNNYSGALQVTDGGLRIGPLASTRKMCPPAIMDQEDRFFRALESVRSARTENGLLYLLDETGKVRLRFWRSKDPR